MTKNELRKYAKSNIIPVDEFVANINDELKKQTQAWRAIATQFALASEQYGRGSKDFKHILDATGFGHTKVIKLIKIASDTRLNDPAFDTLSSWTLLYSISRCSNEQVTELKKLGKKQAITDALVKSVCNPVRMPLRRRHEVQGLCYQRPTSVQCNRQKPRKRNDPCLTPRDRH